MATDNIISDEEFARQLQQEEFGSLLPGSWMPRASVINNNNSSGPSQDISAPLLNDNANNENVSNPLIDGNNGNNDNINNNNNNINGNGNGNRNNGANNNDNAAQRARRNVIGHVRDADTDSPRILLLRITIALLEIIATSTVLAIGWNEGGLSSCNYLKWWALIYTARHFITIPLRIHIRFRINRQNNNNNNNNDQQQPQNAAAAEKSIQILRWLSIMTFLLFLLGQTFLFTEKTCQDTAPTVWYYCLVIIILVYVSLALPFLIVLAICICLPCVLIVFRFFAEPEGADDRIIKDLPTRKITAADLHLSTNGDGNEEKKDDKKDETEDNNNDDDDDDSDGPSCAICMQDYKIDDELRILPCGHEFHTECVDKWLPMKKICPLCRHDITKKIQSQHRSNNNENENENNNDNPMPPSNDINSINNASANGNDDNV